ncbi:MAG TPA: ABC transporter permease [Candidatus Thermoplasmatota archaeon]|nr:ABC transporter permease [Candidatus Thermoplasmatota archaeon]
MTTTAWGRSIRAALYKNWRLSITYPTWLLQRLLSPLVWVAIAVYAYTGVADPARIAEAFAEAAGTTGFTGFLILGQTLFSFFLGMNWRGGMAIQRERWYGTLEIVMLAPTSRVAFILGESVYGLLDSGWTVLLAMVIAMFAFDARFTVAHPEAALLAVLLALLAMVALGVFFSGFYLLTRSAGPLSSAVQAPIRFLAGVQFPVSALPTQIQYASFAIPVTYGIAAVRRVFLAGGDIAAVSGELLALALSTVVFFAIGAYLIGRMEKEAKRRGTLHVY